MTIERDLIVTMALLVKWKEKEHGTKRVKWKSKENHDTTVEVHFNSWLLRNFIFNTLRSF